MSPLGGGEHHEEHGAEEHHHQPVRRACVGSRHAAVAQHRSQHQPQAQQHHQHSKTAGKRAVHCLLHQGLVASPFLVPRQSRANSRPYACRFAYRGQRLITKHRQQNSRSRCQEWCRHGQHTLNFRASRRLGASIQQRQPAVHNLDQARQCRKQRRDSHQTSRAGAQGHRCNDDAYSSGQQSTCRNGALHAHPRQQRAQRNHRLRTQTIVVDHPEAQE